MADALGTDRVFLHRAAERPVGGIPMSLVSYGGTAMLTVLFGFRLLMSAHVHRQVEIPRASGGII